MRIERPFGRGFGTSAANSGKYLDRGMRFGFYLHVYFLCLLREMGQRTAKLFKTISEMAFTGKTGALYDFPRPERRKFY